MNDSQQPDPQRCANGCAVTSSIENLNRTCFCLSLDEQALRQGLEADLGAHGLSAAMIQTHPHLFSSVPMFVSREHIDAMEKVIWAVEDAVATPAYHQAVSAWAPGGAGHDPGSPGGILGYDFHLGPTGPKLIEINTNPGGALLNAVMARAHRSCCADAAGLAMAPMEADGIEEALFEVFLTEWRLQGRDAPLTSVAIVDEAPQQQYLYPEFLLFRHLFRRHDLQAVICDPGELDFHDGRLWHGSQPIDFVYNRLTDFALEQPASKALRQAYLAGAVVVSPHPHAHMLYADKRNLTLLCDEKFLGQTGLDAETISVLLAGIPNTEIMSEQNREDLWTKRRQLFFKPAGGYGSKGAYRGDKLTRRVWQEMTQNAYVAQALVVPSERYLAGPPTPTGLKADLRCYAYRGEVKLVTARLYQGQTTNFRSPRGGFAPVFTEVAP
jgi:hypothetical protein